MQERTTGQSSINVEPESGEKGPAIVDVETLCGIDLNLLIIFVAVYQERSLSKAAKKLGVTQPAISNSLVKIRRHFADSLFERAGYGMKPTPRAQVIYNHLAPAIAAIHLVLK